MYELIIKFFPFFIITEKTLREVATRQIRGHIEVLI